MPYPNEHAARMTQPSKYVRFRRENDKFGSGIHAIFGIPASGGAELQAIRFDAAKFTVAQAKAWLKAHKYNPILFEAATGKVKAESGGEFTFNAEPGSITIEAATTDEAQASPGVPKFSMVAYTGGPMRVAGKTLPLILDLSGISLKSQKVPVRLHHKARMGIGHTVSVGVSDGRLVAQGVLSRRNRYARDVCASAKEGFPWQASVGGHVDSELLVAKGETANVNGKDWAGPVLIASKATVKEFSFVDLGADGDTSVDVAAERAADIEETQMPKTDEGTQDPSAQVLVAEEDVQKRCQQAAEGERGRITAILAALDGDQFKDLRAKAIAEVLDLQAAKALGFEAVKTAGTAQIKDLQAKLYDANKRLELAASGGLETKASAAEERPDGTDLIAAYEQEVAGLVAGGMKKSVAFANAARKLPDAHQAWLASRPRVKSR